MSIENKEPSNEESNPQIEYHRKRHSSLLNESQPRISEDIKKLLNSLLENRLEKRILRLENRNENDNKNIKLIFTSFKAFNQKIESLVKNMEETLKKKGMKKKEETPRRIDKRNSKRHLTSRSVPPGKKIEINKQNNNPNKKENKKKLSLNPSNFLTENNEKPSIKRTKSLKEKRLSSETNLKKAKSKLVKKIDNQMTPSVKDDKKDDIKAKTLTNYHPSKKGDSKKLLNSTMTTKSKTRDKDKKIIKKNDELSKTFVESSISDKIKKNKDKSNKSEKKDKKSISHLTTKNELKTSKKDKPEKKDKNLEKEKKDSTKKEQTKKEPKKEELKKSEIKKEEPKKDETNKEEKKEEIKLEEPKSEIKQEIKEEKPIEENKNEEKEQPKEEPKSTPEEKVAEKKDELPKTEPQKIEETEKTSEEKVSSNPEPIKENNEKKNEKIEEGNTDKLIEELKKEYIEQVKEEMTSNFDKHNITLNPMLNQSLNTSMSFSQSFLLSKSMVDEDNRPKIPPRDPNKPLTRDEIFKDYKNAFIYVLDFLNLQEKIYFTGIHRGFKAERAYLFNMKREEIISSLELKIKETKESRIENFKKNHSQRVLTEPFEKFTVSKSAIKTATLLDTPLYSKLFKTPILDDNLSDIYIIYRLLFVLFGEPEIADIMDDRLFWVKCTEYLITKSNGKIGSFIVEKSKSFDFSHKSIYLMNRLLVGIKPKIVPTTFTKISGTTGLLFFVIKESLEYCGVRNG